MRSALIDRRQFIRGAGLSFFAGLTHRAAYALERTDAVYASGFRARDGKFGLAVLSEQGEFIASIDLPDRMHGLCHNAVNGKIACFARRPGTFIACFETYNQYAPSIVHASSGRHFYGHGEFSPDGSILYASENDFEARRGVIGVYDVTNGYARIGEFPSYGIGPHDITISRDGRLLTVANGGIETHPDFGRTKLNLDRMEPSLVMIDALTGTLVQKHTLPQKLNQLSTRHLAVGRGGRFWFACQYEGPLTDSPPLLGRIEMGEELSFVPLPEDITVGLANYVGTIAYNQHDNLVGIASPRGGLAITLNGETGKVISHRSLPNVAGIAAQKAGFALSSYDGRFGNARHRVSFDQHAINLAGF